MASDKEERDLSMESSDSLRCFARLAHFLVEPTCSAKLCLSTGTIDADLLEGGKVWMVGGCKGFLC
jgi:hypothetical protein